MKALVILLFSTLLICTLGHSEDYQIAKNATPHFANQNAYDYIVKLLKSHPEIERRMLDPTHQAPDERWAYHNQTYGSKSTMLHLLARQIKAMAEGHYIESNDDILDPEFGIGSKNHKDKGTINNPLSWWGHPVQKEILKTDSKLRTLKVYHAFRKTIKNDLIHFARHQSIEWHQQDMDLKLEATMEFLHKEHPRKTLELRDQLEYYEIDLEQLLYDAIASNLLS
jgi:hypothetical protein